MVKSKIDWAPPSIKAFVFWRDGMTPEEFLWNKSGFITGIYIEKWSC